MTDRAGANGPRADESAVDAILLDVIVSPGKEHPVADEAAGEIPPVSSEEENAGETVSGRVPESVSAPEESGTPVVEQESAVSAGSDAMDVSEPASRVPAPEAVETTEPREGADGEEETSEQASSDETDGKLPSTEEDAPVLEGESTPWTPQPKIIDPEADADEIPPLAGGRGAGGALPPSDGEGDDDEEDPEERPMTLLEHLGELRVRLVRSFLAVTVAFFVCYAFARELFYYLSLPLLKVMPADSKFIYTGVAEGFFVDLKVSFVAAVFVACPFLFYQIWAFIAPGLYEEEKRYVTPLALCSAIFFLGGATFCYFVVFPFAFEFFMSYSTDNIVAMLSINEYLSFALKMLIAFGLIFEMPLFSFFLARMGLVTAARMRAVRKYSVLAVFIIAAILTPPDVFSQIMMALPMLVLYEISILVAAAFGKRAKPKKEEDEGEEEAA